jgi:hypothetical protein
MLSGQIGGHCCLGSELRVSSPLAARSSLMPSETISLHDRTVRRRLAGVNHLVRRCAGVWSISPPVRLPENRKGTELKIVDLAAVISFGHQCDPRATTMF